MNEIRRHYFLERWVVVASDRAKRPGAFDIKEVNMRQGKCPFCPENLNAPILHKVGDPWRIAVLTNKFPAVDHDTPMKTRDDFFHSRSGFGYHEVVIDHPEHVQFQDLSEEHLADLLGAYAQRTKDHMSDKRIEYVSIFRNDGAASGASIAHIHSQIIALPVVPRVIHKEHGKIDEFVHMFGECPFEMIYKNEKKEGLRFLLENQHFFAIAPFASVFPGETWIVAKRHVKSLPDLKKEEFESMGAILKDTMVRLTSLFPGVPYNLVVHQAPRGRDFHLHLEIYPRLTKFGGFELANDMYINVLPPEMFANEFKKVKK